MQQIDFYHHVRDPLGFACKLASTVMGKGQRLLVLLPELVLLVQELLQLVLLLLELHLWMRLLQRLQSKQCH